MIMLKPVKPYPWKEHFAVILPLFLMASAIGLQSGWRFPEDVCACLRSLHPVVTDAMSIASKLGASVFYLLFAAVFLDGLRESSHDKIVLCLRVLFFNVLISLIIMHLIKDGLGMPRPGYGHDPVPWSGRNRFHSFPSGHTAEIAGLALSTLGLGLGRGKLLLLSVLVLTVGFSRVWLGAHHPVDLLAGLAVGSFAARLAFYPVRKNTLSASSDAGDGLADKTPDA